MTAPRGESLSVDVLDFYRRALRVVGLNTMRCDSIQAAAVLRSVCAAIRSGHLRAPYIAKRYHRAKMYPLSRV